MSTNKYYTNQEWEYADGWSNADNQFMADDYEADDYSADDFDADAYFADDFEARGSKKPKPSVSKPYMVTVQNTTGANIPNVSIFNSYINRMQITSAGLATPLVSLLTQAGVIYNAPLLSAQGGYPGLLAQSETQPFVCGKIYFQATQLGAASGIAASQPFTVYHTDATGKQVVDPYIPIIDPNWMQQGIIIMNVDFSINGFTNIVISSLLANSFVQYFFYPSKKVDQRKALYRNTIGTGFHPPALTQGQTIVVKK